MNNVLCQWYFSKTGGKLNFLKLMRKPKQQLAAEPKLEAGRGPIRRDSVASELELGVLGFGWRGHTDGRAPSDHVFLHFVISVPPE